MGKLNPNFGVGANALQTLIGDASHSMSGQPDTSVRK